MMNCTQAVCFHCTIFIFNIDMFLISGPWQDQSSERSAGIGSSPPRPLMDEQLRMRKLGRVVINFGDGQWSPPLLGSVGSEPGPPIKVKQLVVVETGLCEWVQQSRSCICSFPYTLHQQALNPSWVSMTPGSLPPPPRCRPAGRDEWESDRLKVQCSYSRTNASFFPMLINVFLS